MNYTYDDELLHYGVKGMKWGVRRDIRVLANRRRNQAVRKVKDQYDLGKISRKETRTEIKKLNTNKKAYIKEQNARLKGMSSESAVRKAKSDIASQTINEVPNRRLKKGLTTVNKILGGSSLAIIGATGLPGAAVATAINPVFGAAYVSSMVGSAAVTAGAHYLTQMGIDKLT